MEPDCALVSPETSRKTGLIAGGYATGWGLRSGATPYNASQGEADAAGRTTRGTGERLRRDGPHAARGFRGVLVELLRVEEGYVLREAAVGTGNRLLKFSSESPELAYAVFEAELGSPG